jgi:hypothetical protein
VVGNVVRMTVRETPTSKECRRCAVVHPASEFPPYHRNRDGFASYCKACQSDRANAYNKKRLRADWAERLLVYVRASYAGGGRTKRKYKIAAWGPTDITKEFLWDLLKKQDGRCYWTQVSLDLSMGSMYSISLDRLDCSRGYTQDNVVLTCKAANLARSDSSPDEMRAFISMIKRS